MSRLRAAYNTSATDNICDIFLKLGKQILSIDTVRSHFPDFFQKPLHLSFQTSPLFMSVSKESIQTLICDLPAEMIVLEKREKLLVVFV